MSTDFQPPGEENTASSSYGALMEMDLEEKRCVKCCARFKTGLGKLGLVGELERRLKTGLAKFGFGSPFQDTFFLEAVSSDGKGCVGSGERQS